MVVTCDCLADKSDAPHSFKGKFCGGPQKCIPILPESGHVLAPWVKICFLTGAGGHPLTVGNKSSPAYPHKAVIKSFEFGHSEGVTVRAVIQDQHGGTFETFFEHLFKDWKNVSKKANKMRFQFGWVKSGCKEPHPESISPCYYAIMNSLETSVSEGKFTVEMTGRDMGYVIPEGGYNGLLGGNGQEGMCLKDAVIDMMTNSVHPNFESVKFVKAIGKDQYIEAGFHSCDDGCSCSNPRTNSINNTIPEDDPKNIKPTINRGPKGKWPGHGQDKFQVALRWLRRNYSNNRKQWIMINNPTNESELLFREDRTPKCEAKGSGYWNPTCVGTYVVNGGKESPVIEFNPKIEWKFGQLTGVGGDLGTTTSKPHDNEGSVSPGRNDCPQLNNIAQPGGGQVVQVTENETSKERYGENSIREDQKSIDEAFKVIQGDFSRGDVEADLVIVGNPTIVQPQFARDSTVHIIFINPYFIDHPNGRVENAKWQIGSEPCNSVLTNIAWRIKSITHKIELGSYTTIINVWLTEPGVKIAPDQQLGGWTGGWRPPTGP